MRHCVGVDVAKAHLDWALGHESEVVRVANSPAGVRRLVRQLRRLCFDRVILEATGGYEELLHRALIDAGMPVVRVNPKRVRDFGKGMGVLAKNDAIDARLLALFGEKAEPAQRPQKGPRARKLAELATRRRQLIGLVRVEKNRLEHTPTWLAADARSLIRILERRIAKIDRKMDELISEDRAQQADFERMQSVPGVGEKTARALLADLPELGRLDRKQIASLAGLAPYAKDSGKKTGVRRIEGGRAAPRTALYLAAMIASRYNPVLKALHDRMRAAGKPPKVVFVAVARKLLTILNAMVRDGTQWEVTA
jgi:transposase